MSEETTEGAPPRLAVVLTVAAIAVAIVGFASGTSEEPPEPPVSQTALTATSGQLVPHYDSLGQARLGPNAELYDGAFEKLREGLPAIIDDVQRTGTIAELRRARGQRRAFDGAPPTIPHVIDQRGYPACLACHEHGAALGDRIAPAMSHEPLSSCIQCHVPEQNPVDLGSTVVDNQFVGLASAGLGARAWRGAPPTIPHTTAMRERCESCHGVSGANPLRTTHPWRQACVQCHVPGAQDSRRAFPKVRGSP